MHHSAIYSITTPPKMTRSFMGMFFLLLLSCFAQAANQKMIFEENKNQWPEQVRFQADIRGGNLFLESNTFTYLFVENVNFHDHHRNPDGPIKVKFHSFKVNFLHSNPDVDISGNNLLSGHRNYYRGNDPSKWAADVRLYNEVYYKDLYSYIDMNIYNVDQNLKYDFIIYPGGNTNDIKLNYVGPDDMHLEYGHLYIKTSVGLIVEQKPYAYQNINGVKTEIPCNYQLRNNTLGFSLGDYDKTLPLIIDPTLIASTYTGSTADNWGFTATYDNAGNIYTGGIGSAQGYPTTVGAYDVTFNGGMVNNPGASSYPFDIVLTKFNPNGTALIFSTYYGGSSNEQPHSLMVNNSNELYVVGRTNSANFPTTNGTGGTTVAYDQTQNGGYDIIVGRFNATGALLSSSFIGGTGDDCVNVSANWTTYNNTKYNYADDGRSEIILDNNSNVYVAACTRSTNFPTTAGAYDATLGGVQDGVVFKMNSTLSALTFSTYLGGSLIDAAYGLKLDNNNNVYATGGTVSTDFPTTGGVINPAYKGGICDGFITVLNNTGTTILRSTYLGTTAYDQSYFIEIDATGDLYVYGQTRGAYPVTAGVYSNPNSAQFIHKVNGLLTTTIFSTVIGSGSLNPNISPTAFLVDSCQSIYISGWGRCSAFSQPNANTVIGMPVTPNAFQSTSLNGCNFYFAVLKPNAQSLWYGTIFGEQNAFAEDHVDGGTSRFDRRAFIYQSVCASCNGTQGWPTTPGAYATTNNSVTPQVNCNNAVVKMDVQVKPLAVAAIIGPSSGCAPFTVSFNNNGSSGTGYNWDFGDGTPYVTIANPSHTYSLAGTYTITLYAIDSLGICGYLDTASVVIWVGVPPVLATTQTDIKCNGGLGSATVTATGGLNPLTYTWNTTPVQSTSVATGLSPGTYTITVKDALGCSSTRTVTITQPPAITLSVTPAGASCGTPNGTATPTVGGGTPGYTYAWNPTGQTTSTATGLLAGNYTLTVTDANGCTKTATASVTVTNGPSANATGTNVSCNGGSNGSATATQIGGTAPYTYSWSNSQTTQTATGLGVGTYTVTITDVNGCSAIATISITQPTALSTSITSTTVFCSGGNNGTATVTASGGTPGYTYAWNTTPAQTSATATGLTAGSYSVLIADANGCTSTKTVTVAQLTMTSTVSTGTITCNGGSNGTATVTAGGGTPGYTYTWSTSPPQSTPNATGLTAGTYSVIVTDANGCTRTNSVTLTQPPPIVATTSSSGSGCTGGLGIGTTSVSITSGGNAPYTYVWLPGGQTTASLSNLTGGTYTVTVTDANGCTTRGTATIPFANQPTALFTYTPSVTCDGVSMQFSSQSTNATIWNWNFGDGTTSTLQNPIHTFPYNGSYSVTLSVSGPPCKASIAQTIVIGDMTNGIPFGAANVFSPNGDVLNDCFHPALKGIINGVPVNGEYLLDCTYLEVFDRWGIKMFESVGATSCWNGNNMNDSKPASDGTYFYIATLGSTTIKGYVTLVRHK